jgi:hypothetical protein
MVNIALVIGVKSARYQSQHWSTSSGPIATAPLGGRESRGETIGGRGGSAQVGSRVGGAVVINVGSPAGMIRRRRLPEASMAIAL